MDVTSSVVVSGPPRRKREAAQRVADKRKEDLLRTQSASKASGDQNPLFSEYADCVPKLWTAGSSSGKDILSSDMKLVETVK